MLSLSISNAVGNSIILLLIFNSVSKFRGYNIITKILAYVITFIISIFLCADIFYYYEFQGVMSIGVFSSIIETTLSESLSVMRAYIIPCIIILLTVFVINCFILKSFTVCKIKGWYSLIAIFPIYAFFIGFAFFRNGDKDSIAYQIKDQPLGGYLEYFGYTLPLFVPDVVLSVIYYAEMSQLKSYANTPKTLPAGYSLNTEDKAKPTKIYVVIGESSSRVHYSLYGYNNPTTPFLNTLSQSTDSILTYYNAISPAAITRDALRFDLTFANPQNFQPFYDNKTAINLANDVGYETIWLSNQERIGMYDSYVGCIAQGASQSMFLVNIKKYPVADDWNLIKTLPEFVIPNKQQFVVLHLQGSHIYYEDKYTSEDTVVTNEDKLVQDYDRSIHHTDTFLSKLYDFVKNQGDDAIIYYISDHGENIEPNNSSSGHGQMTGTDQYKIPLIIINYKTGVQTSRIVDRYIMKDSELINGLSTINILAEIMGYTVSDSSVNDVLEESKYIYHVDGKTYLFDEISE